MLTFAVGHRRKTVAAENIVEEDQALVARCCWRAKEESQLRSDSFARHRLRIAQDVPAIPWSLTTITSTTSVRLRWSIWSKTSPTKASIFRSSDLTSLLSGPKP